MDLIEGYDFPIATDPEITQQQNCKRTLSPPVNSHQSLAPVVSDPQCFFFPFFLFSGPSSSLEAWVMEGGSLTDAEAGTLPASNHPEAGETLSALMAREPS